MNYNDNPYRPRERRKHQYAAAACCGVLPKKQPIELYTQDVATHQMAWQPVYRCAVCGKWYLQHGKRYAPLGNLLRYTIRSNKEEQDEQA